MIKQVYVIAFCAISQPLYGSAAESFASFTDESRALLELLDCPSPGVSRVPGLPDMWSCLFPRAEVVKVFINATKNGDVENIKFMWNDWTRDVGYGLHTDSVVADAWLRKILARYAPTLKDEVFDDFWQNEPKEFFTETLKLSYTFFRGPGIDERLITITQK